MGLQPFTANAGNVWTNRFFLKVFIFYLIIILSLLQDMKENKYFREYIDTIEKTFNMADLSYFELNLETWRQLWRVLEMSDVLLVVVDARFPVSSSFLI